MIFAKSELTESSKSLLVIWYLHQNAESVVRDFFHILLVISTSW